MKIGVVESTRDGRLIRIFADARNSRGQPYAAYVVRGTGPHIIQGNPNLSFQWINRNTFVITPQVQHPGTQENNFLIRALEAFRR